MKRVILVDGNNLVCRAHHVARQWQTDKPSGLPGFRKMLRDVHEAFPGRPVAVVFDPGGVTARMAEYPPYKAHRSQPSVDLQRDLGLAPHAAAGEGCQPVKVIGHEADDVIFTLCRRARDLGLAVTIVTSDADALQLVDEEVTVVAPRKGMTDVRIFRRDAVVAKFGVEPSQIAELKALAGDPSDGLAGVPRIGPKTAAYLLRTFGSLETILAQRPQLRPAWLSPALYAFEDRVRRNLALTRLREVPTCRAIEDAVSAFADPGAVFFEQPSLSGLAV